MKRILFSLSAFCTGFLAFSQNTNHHKIMPKSNTTAIVNKNPKTLFDPTPFAFSHATTNKVDGKYVFISGQSGGEDLKHTLSKDFRTQVKYSLKNLETVLAAYGLGVKDVLKITILIVNHDQEKLKIWTEEMHATWKNNDFPASTLIPVPRLALDDMLIEVDAVAFIKK
ncbi:RidA family protein [Chryseobacterium polytrichastri]|uniref:Enamine deaminase RidA, house cleaning of reactive enamine intermediates, YjgF/YER057c/UK114 family n=1 Tax=Chryseobacterium polytrichastri TaxID=1302687 RepID=A0A1M6RS17_9FLAO|nr:RidA family protein [Chryseobacterium polytrichastri]SHK35312.1 Enamine deaminase RidA, house cleaning of reactive enamine intermediates, YjgF/YER057c/UK114 family [Chryseobacterium polytrichastri]